MKVLYKYVLVEMTAKAKDSNIILETKDDNQKFDYTHKVLEVGPNVEREIKVGDVPVFSRHFMGPLFMKKVKDLPKDGGVFLCIIHEDDIIAIDDGVEGQYL